VNKVIKPLKKKAAYIGLGFLILFFILISFSILIGSLPSSRFSNNQILSTPLSTTQALIIRPAPTPQWVASLQPFPGQIGPFDNHLCVDINKFWLWEPGDFENKVQSSFRSRLQIAVDNISVPINEISFLDDAFEITDNSGNVIGTNSAQAFTCVVTDLKTGEHSATVHFVTTAGTSYTYTWAFKISSTDATDYAAMVQSTDISFQITATVERKFYVITETAVAKLDPAQRDQIMAVTNTSLNATSTAIMARIMTTLVARTSTVKVATK